MPISAIQTFLSTKLPETAAALPHLGLARPAADWASGIPTTAVRSLARDAALPEIPHAALSGFWRSVPNWLPSGLPDFPEATVPLLQAGAHFEFLENLGLPPSVVGPLAIVLAAPGKFLIPLAVLSPTAYFLRLANRPRVELNGHIEDVNRTLPGLLAGLEPLEVLAIRGTEDARKITERLQTLQPYAEPHWVEKFGEARPLLTRFFLTKPVHAAYVFSSGIANDTFGFLIRPAHAAFDWPRVKILSWLERKVAAMGENETPRTGTLFHALLRKWKALKRKVLRDAIVVFRGREPVTDYASPELAPEAVGRTALALGSLVETRLSALKKNLDDPEWRRRLPPADRASLAEELALYDDLLRYVHPPYSDYQAVERYLGLLIDVQWRLDGLRSASSFS